MHQLQAEGRAPVLLRPSRGRQVRLAALAVLSVLVADQITKALAVARLEGDPVDLGFVRLAVSRNLGSAFSLLEGQVWLFFAAAAIVTVVSVVALRRPQTSVAAAGLGLVLGGAWSNIIDRLLRSPGAPRGGVVDFIDFKVWPVFNLADCAIVVGAGLLVVFAGRPRPVADQA